MKKVGLTFITLFLWAALAVPTAVYSDTSTPNPDTNTSKKDKKKKQSTTASHNTKSSKTHAKTSVHSSKKKSKKSRTTSANKKNVPATETTNAPAPVPTPVPKQVERNNGVPRESLLTALTYAKSLYVAKQFDKAKEVFKKIVIAATDSDLSADSLYLYSQCAFRTEDFMGCVKSLNILAKRWPDCPEIKSGYVSRFCYFIINDVARLQTYWDYYRFKERMDADGNPVWKESVPPGVKIKRINFKLGFGLYRVLNTIDPKSPLTASAKQKLQIMLNAPITMLWVDEKAPPVQWGHPGDFLSTFSTVEKKDFSKVICDRMFFDWQTEKFYLFLDMYDDVRNEKPRFIAKSKLPEEADASTVAIVPGAPAAPAAQQDPTIVLTLTKLFAVSGYNPFDDNYTNVIESSPTDLNL